MSTYTQLVVGVFQNEAEAKNALEALRNAGFEKDQLGLALREGGAVTSNLLNDLVKLGVPQDRAGFYDSEYRAGRAILSVRADGREQEATNIIRNFGAYDYDTRGSYAQTTDATAAQAGTYAQTTDTAAAQAGTLGTATERDRAYDDTERRSIPLREEVLQADKERVQTGEARLRKEVVSEERSIDVPVTHEEVYVERRPYDTARPSDAPIGTDEVIRVPVSEEQVNVNKTAVETGEVSIRKQGVQENQRVSDTVRREEVRLEKDGDPRIRTNDDVVNP